MVMVITIIITMIIIIMIAKISRAFDDCVWHLSSMVRDSDIISRHSSAEDIEDVFTDALEAFDASVRQLLSTTTHRLLRIADESDRDRSRRYVVLESKKSLCRDEIEGITGIVRRSLEDRLKGLKEQREEDSKYKMIPYQEEDEVTEIAAPRIAQSNSVFVLNISADATDPIHTVLARKSEPKSTITKDQLDNYMKTPFSTSMKQLSVDPAGVKITSLDKSDCDKSKLCAIAYQAAVQQAPEPIAGGYGARPVAQAVPIRYQVGYLDLDTMAFTKLMDSDIQVAYLFKYKDLIVCMDIGPTKLRISDKSGAQMVSRAFETTSTSAQASQINLCPVAIVNNFLLFMSLGGEIIRMDLDKDIVAELLYVGNRVKCFVASDNTLFGVDDTNMLFTADIISLQVTNRIKLEIPKEIKESLGDKAACLYYGAILTHNAILIFSKYTKGTNQHQAIQSFRLSDFSMMSTLIIGIEGANSRFEQAQPLSLHGISHLLLVSNQGFSSAYLLCTESASIVLRRVVKLTSDAARGVGDKQSICLAHDGKIVIGFSTKDKVLCVEFK